MGMSERVLVVPTAEFERLGKFQGFTADADRYLHALLTPDLARFLPRSEVEEDPGFKQIIPYVLFRSREMIFAYTRGKSSGESRLRRLRSLGVGGHVAEADADGSGTLEAYDLALRRELNEELFLPTELGPIRRLGLINDDTNPVGRVHLGVVHQVELNAPTLRPREDALADAGFVAVADLLGLHDEFETWSQICIDAFLA